MSINCWQAIFLQSKVNGGFYAENELPHQKWKWPQGTWFQERLHFIREKQWPILRGKDLETALQTRCRFTTSPPYSLIRPEGNSKKSESRLSICL